ncbi:hypothetical protein LP419_35975 [Massilia sp. H-1]|nr:hypothetical protein LP419_35975 [Massilia sp. H-1]
MADWDKTVARHPDQPLKAVTGAYLSLRHRDHPGQGCTVAALGPEVARLSPEVRAAMTDGIARQIDKLASLMLTRQPGTAAPGRAGHLRRHGRGAGDRPYRQR